ncbi:MAG: HlyD family secretion protein [Treponema sp.]|nr:HlyD family secretion protein [Treponema sp.]
MKVYYPQTIPYTQEYFMRKKPSSQRAVIWIITIILVAAILFISFAKFEEVIKVNGYIRPQDNISSVANAVTGRIKSISYTSGQQVIKGQLLLEIDPIQLEAEKESLVTQIKEEQEKLSALYEIKNSIQKNENLINKNHCEAYLRFEIWKNSLLKLENIRNLNYEKYEQEKSIPPKMTTVSRLNDLESQYLISCNDYNNLNLSFQHDIENEIITYETAKKINEAKLLQIEDSMLFTKITAPIDGIIQEITAFNKNDWIQAGQQLFNIVPYGKEAVKVELIIPAKQAGKIEDGLKVKMRFPSLPYHEFGGAEGTILTIAPDANKKQNGDAFFVLKTDLDKNFLKDKKGREYPLKVGLQVDARIIVSKKTILKFVLEKMNLWY